MILPSAAQCSKSYSGLKCNTHCGEAFLDLIQTDAVSNRLVLKLMANRIRYTALRHSYHQSHPLEANLKKLLQEFPDILQKIAKKDIANYLGITVRSLNRMIRSMP